MKKRNRESLNSNCSIDNPVKKLVMEELNNVNVSLSMTEFEQSVLNSTAKLDAELTERVKPLDQAIRELEGKENPTIKDMAKALVILMTSHKEALAEQNSLKKQLFSLTKKTVENSLTIKNMQSGFSHDVLKLTARINQMEQGKIDKEIAISGFPSKPDPALVISELCKFYDIPESMIRRSYSFEFQNKSTKKLEGQLVIKFQSKSDHIKINKLKLQKGTNFMPDPENNPSSGDANNSLKIFNRLTKVNRSIIASLRRYQKEGKILKDGVRYRNCCFEIKIDVDSEFQPVPSIDLKGFPRRNPVMLCRRLF
jgi:hypothetical protein